MSDVLRVIIVVVALLSSSAAMLSERDNSVESVTNRTNISLASDYLEDYIQDMDNEQRELDEEIDVTDNSRKLQATKTRLSRQKWLHIMRNIDIFTI